MTSAPDGEVPDEDQPPAMSFRIAADSDSYDIVPPPAWRVNWSLSASSLSSDRQSSVLTGKQLRQLAAFLLISPCQPKPHGTPHTNDCWSRHPKKLRELRAPPPRRICRGNLAWIHAKAPRHIDLWLANKTNEPQDTIPVNPADTAADALEVSAKGVKGDFTSRAHL